MSRILDVQDKLRDTSEAIARFERVCATEPPSLATTAMLKSFEKRRGQLEREFLAIAAQIGVDVCRYRFLVDTAKAAVAPICTVLVRFQTLYSIVYDAIKTGAKKRLNRLTDEVIAESTLVFGHTFPGSLGVAMTVDDGRRGLFGSTLDDSMRTVLGLARSRNQDDVLRHGKLVGVPAIRALHKWAAVHVEAAQGAEIEWHGGNNTVTKILLQLDDLQNLLVTINATTDVIEEEVEYIGKLSGSDVTKRTFHFESPDGLDIKGTFAHTISAEQTFVSGGKYKVLLRKKVRVYYSTDEEEDVSYQLVMATPILEHNREAAT